MRTTFESESWIEYTPAQELKAKDKDAVQRLVTLNLPATAEGAQELPALDAASRTGLLVLQRDACYARVLTGWSYDLPLPRIAVDGASIDDRDSFGELPIDDYDELVAALAPHQAKLLRVPSPKGPHTVTSSSSNGSSRAKAGRSRTE